MKKCVKIFFILLFLTVPFINILSGNSLSIVHLSFFIFAYILCFVSKNDFNKFLDYIKNFKKFEIANLIKIEQQVQDLKEMNTLNPIKSESGQDNINERYAKEFLLAKLKLNYDLINQNIREIYGLLYQDNVSHIDIILIFDYLRQNDILNEKFCYYVYTYCAVTGEIINSVEFNDYNQINDLVVLGEDIIEKLNYVKQYILNLQSSETV